MDKKIQYRFNEEPDERGKPQHLHELSYDSVEWKPLTGTSSVGNIIAKTLTWWASGMAVEKLGWINPKPKIDRKYIITPIADRLKKARDKQTEIRLMSAEEYLDLLDEAYRAHADNLDDTASEGTDTHALCEEYLKSVMNGNPVEPTDEKVKKLAVWVKKNVKRVLWSEMCFFSEKWWLGGIGDGGVELNNGEIAVLDFKHAKDVYFNNLIQIALYDIEVSENGGYTKAGEKIFTLEKPITKYIVFPFGANDLEDILQEQMDKPYDIAEFKKYAINALELYRGKSKFEK